MCPQADLSPVDGRCRIGLPRYVTIPIVSYDITLNLLLTSTFVYLLSPLIRSGTLSIKAFPATRLAECLSSILERSKGNSVVLSADKGNQHVVEKLEKLLWKTFLGSVLVMVPTIANIVAITVLNGRELGWVCLTACNFDGTLSKNTCLQLIDSMTSGLDCLRGPLVDRRYKCGSRKTGK